MEKHIVVIYNWEDCDAFEFAGYVEAVNTGEKQPFRSVNELDSILADMPTVTIEHSYLKLVVA